MIYILCISLRLAICTIFVQVLACWHHADGLYQTLLQVPEERQSNLASLPLLEVDHRLSSGPSWEYAPLGEDKVLGASRESGAQI